MNSDRLWPIGIGYSLLASAWVLQELTCLLSAVEVIMTFHGVISLLSWRESCQSEPSRFFEIVILDRNEVVSPFSVSARIENDCECSESCALDYAWAITCTFAVHCRNV